MQKKLMVMTIATALSTPAMALADVTVYGKADLATGVLSNGTTKNAEISSQVTKLGFKGSEKLDGGISAIWQIEQQIDMDGAVTPHLPDETRFSLLNITCMECYY